MARTGRFEIAARDLAALSTERRRILQAVSKLSRLGSFRLSVLFAYGNRCAVTRAQLRLVDAAHILPVGAPQSSDHVCNGVALSPTYHRAFDNGLIYLDDEFRMQVNPREVDRLRRAHLDGGYDAFRNCLGRIFLPPDPAQRPALEYIRLANNFRRITT